MSFEKILRAKLGTKFKKTRGAHGVEYRINCPLCVKNGHSPDKGMKMYINPEFNGGVYQCFRCSSKGSTRSLMGWVHSAPDKPAPIKLVAPGKVRMPGELIPLALLPEEHPAIQYLLHQRKRAFDPLTLSTYYGVAYVQRGVRFGDGKSFLYDTTGTLVFPVFNKGELIGWQSRMMVEPEKLSDSYLEQFGYPKDENGKWVRPPKYFTSPGFPKGRVLYNFDMARGREPVVICEGVFDALAVGPSGVALLGKGITDTQMRILQTYCNEVVIMLDPDAGAESKELVKVLRRSIKVHAVTIEGYKDAGDAPTEEIWRQIAAAVGEKANPQLAHAGSSN